MGKFPFSNNLSLKKETAPTYPVIHEWWVGGNFKFLFLFFSFSSDTETDFFTTENF
jgi:hypothetical protein